jgi:hypothetical protein
MVGLMRIIITFESVDDVDGWSEFLSQMMGEGTDNITLRALVMRKTAQ